jgi:hydrogenase expression/formation protein HypC
MCLAVPGKITAIHDEVDPIFRMGTVSFGGVQKEVNLAFLPEAKEDDYVMVHVGVALSIVDEEDAKFTMQHLKKMGEWPEETKNEKE